jgi:O-antigen/teichoic acid export membrane protein
MLKHTLNKIFEKLGIANYRTKNIVKHTGLSFILKAGSIVANFLLVPLTIDYLDKENFGIWLTISSFVAWFSFFNIGLGNGLRNKFAEARTQGNDELAKAYLSTAYFTIGAVSIFIIFVFLVINPFIDWVTIFNTNIGLKHELKMIMPVIVTFFGLQLTANLITMIYLAEQHHSIQNTVQFITQIFSLLVIWFLVKTNKSSLFLFSTIFSALPALVLLLFNAYAFKTKYNKYKPTIKLWKKIYLKDLLGLGLNFFIIQIAGLVIFSTDNFIISQLFSPAEVVPYNIAYKYFSIVILIYTIIITPYWSSFTDAYIKKDFNWIKSSVRTIQKIWLFIPLILLIMILLSNWFYKLWIGNEVYIPFGLSVSMALFVLLMTFNMIYVYFMNGVGKIRIQLLISILMMFINIPISIFFAKNLDFGVTGVILGTSVCLLLSTILFPIQYFKIINNEAYGIWNK